MKDDVEDGGPVDFPDEERCQWRCRNRKESCQKSHYYCSEHTQLRGQKRRRRRSKNQLDNASESNNGVYTRTRSSRKEKVFETSGGGESSEDDDDDDEDCIIVFETRAWKCRRRENGDKSGKRLEFVGNQVVGSEKSGGFGEEGQENGGSSKEDEVVFVKRYSRKYSRKGVSVRKFGRKYSRKFRKAAIILENGEEGKENGGNAVEKGTESQEMATENCGEDGGSNREDEGVFVRKYSRKYSRKCRKDAIILENQDMGTEESRELEDGGKERGCSIKEGEGVIGKDGHKAAERCGRNGSNVNWCKNNSRIKVAHSFISPENVGGCFRLTEEDKLEMKKLITYAVKEAVKDLETIGKKSTLSDTL